MYAPCCRSRQEMAQAVHSVHQQVAEGSIAAVNVTADVIEQELYTQVWLFVLTCFIPHLLGLPNENVGIPLCLHSCIGSVGWIISAGMPASGSADSHLWGASPQRLHAMAEPLCSAGLQQHVVARLLLLGSAASFGAVSAQLL